MAVVAAFGALLARAILELPVVPFVVVVTAAYALAAGLDLVPPGRLGAGSGIPRPTHLSTTDPTDRPRNAAAARSAVIRSLDDDEPARWQPWLALPATALVVGVLALIAVSTDDDPPGPDVFELAAAARDGTLDLDTRDARPANESTAIAGFAAPATAATPTPSPTPVAVATGKPVGGVYNVVDIVTSGPGPGAMFTFTLTLTQDGSIVKGTGNGLTLEGGRNGDDIRLEFARGTGSGGSFFWRVQDNGVLVGTFEDSTSATGGTSIAIPRDGQ